jgi:hypothetical protein
MRRRIGTVDRDKDISFYSSRFCGRGEREVEFIVDFALCIYRPCFRACRPECGEENGRGRRSEEGGKGGGPGIGVRINCSMELRGGIANSEREGAAGECIDGGDGGVCEEVVEDCRALKMRLE